MLTGALEAGGAYFTLRAPCNLKQRPVLAKTRIPSAAETFSPVYNVEHYLYEYGVGESAPLPFADGVQSGLAFRW